MVKIIKNCMIIIFTQLHIVTFKDTKLANEHPEWTFKNSDGSVWTNGKGIALLIHL